jgi:exopolysaccharide biosynthesis polyprenyl glycosylphosphotransferase
MSKKTFKRTFDIFFSLTALVLLSPVFFLLAVLVKSTSPGPVLFKQKRIGESNREFFIYKFRTMVLQSRQMSDQAWTTVNDERVTRVGRVMRRTGLDELPQFWNVLVGDMSVVGPRPERKHFVDLFKQDLPNYMVRHLVKAGITGWAQVNGLRGDSSIAKRLEYDIQYTENWNLWLDLKIIWLTLFGSDVSKNAY